MKKIVCVLILLSMAFLAGCQEAETLSPSDGLERETGLPGQSVQESTGEISAEYTETAGETAEQPERMLFVGDSRTVGLMEYSGLDADFFAAVGMTVYNIHDEALPVPGVGKLTLDELLSAQAYGKIYLMLGINELGYPQEGVVQKYDELISFIRQQQPDAELYLQANLHVSAEESDENSYINNSAIDRINSRIAEFADGESVFYMDVNSLFDDDSGSLDASYTADGVHPYAKHYQEWANWMVQNSAGENE